MGSLFKAMLVAIAAGVLLFAGVATAQSDGECAPGDIECMCAEVDGEMQGGTCIVPTIIWCGFDDDPQLCEEGSGSFRVADDVLDEFWGSVPGDTPAPAAPASPTPAAPTYTG